MSLACRSPTSREVKSALPILVTGGLRRVLRRKAVARAGCLRGVLPVEYPACSPAANQQVSRRSGPTAGTGPWPACSSWICQAATPPVASRASVVSVAVIVMACPEDSRPRRVAGTAARSRSDAGAAAPARPSACGGRRERVGQTTSVRRSQCLVPPWSARTPGSRGPRIRQAGRAGVTRSFLVGLEWGRPTGPGGLGREDIAHRTRVDGAPQPVQYHGDPPTRFPQFKQNRMCAPRLPTALRPRVIVVRIRAIPERPARCC
jgi:hypothetical protein